MTNKFTMINGLSALLIVFTFSACKKKSSSNSSSNVLAGIISLRDSTVNFSRTMPRLGMYALDMNQDGTDDVTFMSMQHASTDNADEWIFVTGDDPHAFHFSFFSLPTQLVCTSAGSSTTSPSAFPLAQVWNHSGDVVQADDTASSSNSAHLFNIHQSFSSQGLNCRTKAMSTPGGNNEGFIIVRKRINNTMQLGWIKIHYAGDSLFTFKSFRPFRSENSTTLP